MLSLKFVYNILRLLLRFMHATSLMPGPGEDFFESAFGYLLLVLFFSLCNLT